MKKLILTLTISLVAPMTANAYTWCTNKVEKNHGGMSFFVSPKEQCPDPESFTLYNRRAHYRRTGRACEFTSHRTKVSGDRLVCKFRVTLKQIIEDGNKSPNLKKNPAFISWLKRQKLAVPGIDYVKKSEDSNTAAAPQRLEAAPEWGERPHGEADRSRALR